RTGRGPDLGAQRHAKAFVALESRGRGDEPLTPGVWQIRRFDRSAVVPAGVVIVLRDGQGSGEPGPRRSLLVDGVGVEVQLSDAARSRVVEARIHRPIQVLPEVPADLSDDRDVGHRERGYPRCAEDGYEPTIGRAEGPPES